MPHASHRSHRLLPFSSALLLAGLALIATSAKADVPRDAYTAARSALQGDDQSGRYLLLLKFYYANEKNQATVEFAKTEADQLAKDFPDSNQIKTLSRVISDRAERVTEPTPTPVVPITGPKENPDAPTTDQPKADGNKEMLPIAPAVGILSKSDQNLLRLYELNFSIANGKPTGPDAKARVDVPKETIVALLSNYADAKELAPFKIVNGVNHFRKLPPLAQLDLFFAVQAKDMYSKVTVKSEPEALRDFRVNIHRQLMHYFTPYFAGQIPGLIAKPKSTSTQDSAYTNFFALSSAVVDGHPVIDRTDVTDSLLLQWGLPRILAKYPAPNIKGWKPYFHDAKDPSFVKTVKWIQTLYGHAIPNYSFTLPAAPGAKSDDTSGKKQR